MRKLNKKALAILTSDEQSALALQNVHNKSTWEAGSIMNKSHYKYLEIKQRAERFFQMFSIHYDTYNELIPSDLVKLDEVFRGYLIYTMEKRLSVKNTISKIGTTNMLDRKEREAFLEKEIIKLRNTDTITAQNLYSLVMEFDRYNNFRILPLSVQEPSAFKRRNKTRFRKHLNISTTIHPYVLMRIKELYEYSKGPKPKLMGYIVLLNYEGEAIENIIPVNANQKTLKELSSISLYVFLKIEQAEEYIELVRDYINNENKDPRTGLLFWPKFRTLIKESLNYNDINNISPSRKGLMSALKDMDDNYARSRKIAQNKNSYK